MREGQREDSTAFGAGMRQQESTWEEQRAKEKQTFALHGTDWKNRLINADPKTVFNYCPAHPPVAMDAIKPLKPQ